MIDWIKANVALFAAIVAAINLAAFMVSVFFLWRTKLAAERQSERTAKPLVCLIRKNWELKDDQLLEPQLNVEVAVPFTMRNVGNGTAFDVHWRFKTEKGDERIHGMTTHIQPDKVQNTGLELKKVGLSENGGVCIFECEYRGITQQRYRTTQRIEGVRIVKNKETRVWFGS